MGEAEQGRRGEGREGAAASQRSGELQFRMALGDPRGEEGGDCQLGGGGEPRECGSVSLRATGPASLGGILHDQMLVLDECISDLNLLVLRDRTRSVESGGVTRSTGEAESSAFAGGLTGACGMMIHLLIRCVMRVRPDEHTTFHLAMLSDPMCVRVGEGGKASARRSETTRWL